MKPTGSRIFDFESKDQCMGMKFIDVLQIFDIVPVDYAITVGPDGSWVRFCTTKKVRTQIEYVYRRFMNLDKTEYLLDLDEYQNRQERFEEEGYAIY